MNEEFWKKFNMNYKSMETLYAEQTGYNTVILN